MTTIVEELTQRSTLVQEQAIQPAVRVFQYSGIIIIIVGAAAAYLVVHGKKTTTSGRICEKCNAELPPNAKFCKKCELTVDQAK